jgi:hypothetical protein
VGRDDVVLGHDTPFVAVVRCGDESASLRLVIPGWVPVVAGTIIMTVLSDSPAGPRYVRNGE